MHPTHNKLYIFVILITSRLIWYTWKVIWSILRIWPPLDPCVTPTGNAPNRPKFFQNIFWPITTLKPSITHFRQNGIWVHLPLHSSVSCNSQRWCAFWQKIYMLFKWAFVQNISLTITQREIYVSCQWHMVLTGIKPYHSLVKTKKVSAVLSLIPTFSTVFCTGC